MKFDDAVLKANTVIFDQAQMMKDDNGKWAFYLKAHGEEGFAILPSAKDVNEFFTTIQHGDDGRDTTIVNKKDTLGGFDVSVDGWTNSETHDILL